MANLADLAIGITAEADTSGIDEFESGVEGMEDTTSSAASFIEDNFMKIGAAAAGIGAGLEGFARSQQEANVGFERMGRVTGEGSEAMRNMATDLQNVTFPMEDVTSLMETATQRGLEGDAIAEYATFWDMVGDATGEAGPELAKAGVALGQVGIAAGEEEEALAAFGYITDQTTGSVEGFLGFIEKTATELGDATPDVNEMAGALGALEDQGLSSSRAQRELRSALSETDGDMMAALETLGVSEEAFREQVDAVDASSGSIEANAQAYADSFTPMQRMSAQLENTMTKYGGLASAAGAVSAPLAGVGSAMMGVSMVAPNLVSKIGSVIGSMGEMVGSAASWAGGVIKSAGKAAAGFAKSAAQMVAAGASWVASTVAQGARAVASMAVTTAQFIAHYARLAARSLANAARVAASWLIAMGPIALVIAAVVGLVALIVKNWDTIKKVISAGWNWVKDKTSAFKDAIVGFIGTMRDRVVAIATGIRDKVLGFFTGLKDGAVEKVQAMIDRVRQIKDDILGFFSGAGRWLVDAGKNIIAGLAKGITDKINAVKDAIGSAVDKVKRFLPGSPVKEGPLTILNRGQAGNQIAEMLASGIAAKTGLVASAADRLAAAATPGARVPSVRGGVIGGDGASAGGPVNVRVFIGDRELTDIVGTEVDRRDGDLLVGLRKGPR